MEIVDFHSHFFSAPFFQALAAQSPQPGTVAEKLARLAAATGIELPPEDVAAHRARWLAELDLHGVDHLATFASLPEEISAVAAAAAGAGGRLTPIALVDPRAPEAPQRVASLLAERGYAGVLVFPALHHFDLAGPEMRALVAVLAARRAVVYVHCGLLVVKLRDLLGLPRHYDLTYADPLRLIPTAEAFPEVPFVIPHFGAGFFRETLLAGAQCPNVYVDSSSSNSWMRTQAARMTLEDVFERALGVFGAERILFGTDSSVFPAGWRAERLEEQRRALDALGVPPAEQGKIFAGNARRLLAAVGR